jgi:hypothetical protein
VELARSLAQEALMVPQAQPASQCWEQPEASAQPEAPPGAVVAERRQLPSSA